MGLAYMISAVAIFDEYTNDLLYLREGSCLPRYVSMYISYFHYIQQLPSTICLSLACHFFHVHRLFLQFVSKPLLTDRPKYRKADVRKCETGKEEHKLTTEPEERQQNGHHKHRRVLHPSKKFMQTVQRLRPIQVCKSLLIMPLS